jgi:hypothetical protein
MAIKCSFKYSTIVCVDALREHLNVQIYYDIASVDNRKCLRSYCRIEEKRILRNEHSS